jgi:hypothetical protein
MRVGIAADHGGFTLKGEVAASLHRAGYGLNLTIVNKEVDPTFRFMTVNWDGQIRMDPSSPYAMERLIGPQQSWAESSVKCRLVSSGSWTACSMAHRALAEKRSRERHYSGWMAVSGRRTKMESFRHYLPPKSRPAWGRDPVEIRNLRASSVSLLTTVLRHHRTTSMDQPRSNYLQAFVEW